MSKRNQPPTNRTGETHKIKCGNITIYVTINKDAKGRIVELFGKSDEGYQGWVNMLMLTASLALQHGCPLETIVRHWRHQRFEPSAFGCSSLPDAIAAKLEEVAA